MDEKYFKELNSSIRELKDKLELGNITMLRGPIADPGPEIYQTHIRPEIFRFRGPIADPVPWQLLDKSKIAVLRINQLENLVHDLRKQIDLLEQEKKLLKEEFRIK